MASHIRAPVISALSVAVLVSTVSAQRPVRPTEVGWVGLYNEELIDWLENENRLTELCPDSSAPSARRGCRDEKLRPKQHVVALRNAPRTAAKSTGSLAIVATPGKGLRAYYRSAGGRSTQLVPDLFEGDWGYGPYFHQTFVQRRGSWFLLPARPFPKPLWIDATQFAREPDVRHLDSTAIIQSPRGDLVVLGLERNVLRARREQPADMWCRDGEPPPLAPWTELRIPIRELYDASGHLRVHFKYTKGC